MIYEPRRIWATGVGERPGQESGTFVEKGEKWPEPPNADAIEYVSADVANACIEALEAQLAEARGALGYVASFHQRYCDRVGPSDSWARHVQDKVQSALEVLDKDANP